MKRDMSAVLNMAAMGRNLEANHLSRAEDLENVVRK